MLNAIRTTIVLLALALPLTAQARRPLTPEQVWVRSAFAQCVRLRESHNGADPNADGNLYGVERQPGWSGGTYSWARNVPRAQQDRIAYAMFLRDGDQPWRPYDGCAA